MGWINSPPVFTAATEAAADIANKNLKAPVECLPPHLLDNLAATMDEEAR